MKKQFFFLFVVMIATIVEVSAQPYAKPGTAPQPLTCTLNDPLNPIAGRPYDYTAIIDPVAGSAYWYATKSTTFMTAGVRPAAIEIPADGTAILANATNYMSTTYKPAASPATTTVTWTSAGLAGINSTTSPLFMVLEYANPSCTNNNVKVMQIIPKVAFTVDITNMASASPVAPLTYGTLDSQCFDKVASATFNAGKIDIDYGTNVLYFEVVAANFTGSYKPTLRLSGLQGSQTAAIDWGVAIGTYDQPLVADVAHTAGVITSPQFTVSTQELATDKGVSIYVRVTIRNHGYEGTVMEPIKLAVEAVDSQNNKDVIADCSIGAGYEDEATQNLNPRPSVTPGTPMLPQNPAN